MAEGVPKHLGLRGRKQSYSRMGALPRLHRTHARVLNQERCENSRVILYQRFHPWGQNTEGWWTGLFSNGEPNPYQDPTSPWD
jgi:hypothetical protein